MIPKRIIFAGIYIFIIAFAITSCNKNDSAGKIDIDTTDKQMLKFESFNEFEKAWNEVNSNNISETSNMLKSQNNYASFAEEADEFYFNIDLDAFSSSEDLMSFVNENRNYLSVSYDDDGDMVVEPIVSNNLMRAFINEDGLFQIADSVYKVFETATVGTKVTDLQLLKDAEETDIEQLVSSGNANYLRWTTGMYSYRTVYWSNKKRLVARLFLWFEDGWFYVFEAKSTAQTKVFGTWWQMKIGSIGIKHQVGNAVHFDGVSHIISPATYSYSNHAVCERDMYFAPATNMVNTAESSLILTHFGTYDGAYKEIASNEVFR